MKACARSFFALFFMLSFTLGGTVIALCADESPGTSTAKRAQSRHLRLLSGPNGGQWHALGNAMAEVLTSKVLPSASRLGGGISNIAAINKKQGDIAFTLTCFLGAAQSGEAEYQKFAMENVSLLANVYPQVLYFLLRKDFTEKYGITSVESLLNQKQPLRFASLKPGTASEFILSLLLKYGYNTDFAKLRKQGWNISFNNYAETADNFTDDKIDCFAYTAGTTVPLIHTIEKHTDIVILPVDQRALEVLGKKFKTGTYVIQPGDYKNVNVPVHTLGDYTSLVVQKELPDDLVYAVSKAIWEGRAAMAATVDDFGALSAETAMPDGLPIHPGAQRFWKELLKSGAH